MTANQKGMRRSVLASAIPNVATVLQTLIYDYTYPLDYECRPLPVLIMPTTTTLSTSIDGKQRLYHTVGDAESTNVFVSKTTTKTGCLKWTVAWTWTTDGYEKEIGIGVTNATDSYRNAGFSTSRDQPDKRGVVWYRRNMKDFFCDWPHSDGGFHKSALQASTVDGFAADGVVCAVADPDKMQVRFRTADCPDDDDNLFVVQVSTPDEFWSLRPLIAVRDAVDVLLISHDD